MSNPVVPVVTGFVEYDDGTETGAVASAQIALNTDTDEANYDQEVNPDDGPQPHVCRNLYPKEKYRPLCHVFDKEMHDIVLEVSDVTGYTEIDGDGKCHYPLNGNKL
jgi:hypothetical protein